MFYEGSEKRLEITCSENLLEFDISFWQEMVKQAGAYIISQVENGQLKAFLLSESSLFVWENKLLLITCGETHLLQAALHFQKKINRSDIASLLFQRHQSKQPERQKSNFQQDSLQLQKKLKGDSRHWTNSYCGDIFIFGNNQQTNTTKNILMLHELNGEFYNCLQQGKICVESVEEQLKLATYFNGFTIDQYTFEPKGYSLNAIEGERYFTLHITPENLSSYTSFESNLPDNEVVSFYQHLIDLFKPQRAYLMLFNTTINTLDIETKVLV